MTTNVQGNTNPEQSYKTETNPTERRRIQAAVIEAHRPHVAALVRRLVPAEHREEGQQVGALGVLVALEKYDDGIAGPDRGKKCFWGFAYLYVRDELQRWIDVGVNWRKTPNRGKSAARKANRQAASIHRQPARLDAPLPGDDGGTLQDLLQHVSPTVEELFSVAETLALLLSFARTLSAKDRKILFSENSQCMISRHYLSLVERATAFMQGSRDGHGRHEGNGAATAGSPAQ